MKEINLKIDKYYSGIARDDKSRIIGSAFNMEEIDIFTNENYFQAEQIFSSYALPASTNVYAFAAGDNDTLYAYGKETVGNKVRISSVANGGANNPSTLASLFTSADSTNIATIVSDLKFFRTSEGNPTYVYYIQGASTTWYLVRYDITAAAEKGAGSGSATFTSADQLTGLNGTNMRPTMKVIFGELFICHGQFIAKVASDGTLTLKAFTLPTEWEAVDIEAVGDAAIILCRNKSTKTNLTAGYWWDLSKTQQFEDYFLIPMGGPQWIKNAKEIITIMCAVNGVMKLFRLSAAAKGATPLELPGIVLNNIGAETSTQPISSPKMVAAKDKFIYFGLFKTDKTGVYQLGQMDFDKPIAILLTKRFTTTDYSAHTPYAVHIQGPNFYGAYDDNGTNAMAVCKTNNSPSRSSNAVYESLWIDAGDGMKNKNIKSVIVSTYPLAASTAVAPSIAFDYSSSYTALTQADATTLNVTNAVQGMFPNTAGNNNKVVRIKIALTSSGTSSPKVVGIGLIGAMSDEIAVQ